MNASFQQLCEELSAAGVPDARYDAAELYRFVTGRDPRLDTAPTLTDFSALTSTGGRRARQNNFSLFSHSSINSFP
mgnify:CR=1 FL=1